MTDQHNQDQDQETDIICIVDGSAGIYVPQRFAANMDRTKIEGVTDEDWETLEEGPDHEHYWEAWEDVLNNAVMTAKGKQWRFMQEGDLFAYDTDPRSGAKDVYLVETNEGTHPHYPEWQVRGTFTTDEEAREFVQEQLTAEGVDGRAESTTFGLRGLRILKL